MKLKNLGYIKLLSVIMTLLMLVSFVPAAAVNDDGGLNSQTSETSTDSYESSAKADNAAELETESVSIEFEVEEDKGNSGLGTAGDAGDQTRLPPSSPADGVYMLENLYHTGYYMSVRGASLDAGARIVPRQYSSGTPISTFDRQALFKISKVPGTTRYVIRSMLNNGIGLGIVNGKVVTKELPFDDADVSANDTFTITGLPTSGYQINPYVGGGILAAELGTMSDDPSVGAYVVQGNASTVGNRGKWTLTAYSGVGKYGFDYFRTVGMGDGLVKGYTYYMWPKSWSTAIGANTPCITVDSAYSGVVSSTWDEDELCATFFGNKCDDFDMNMEIRIGDAQTATNTITRGYTVIPDIVEKTAYIRNVATDKYMEVENGTTAEGGIVQQWEFHTASHMQWMFELDGNGFFRIKSVKSGKYLGTNSSNISEVRQYGTVTDYLRWKIVETSSGNYKIVCKGYEEYDEVLTTVSNTAENGDNLQLTIYSNDTNYQDEWAFTTMLPISGYELDYNTEPWSGYVSELCNCYAYAINNQLNKSGALWSGQQPGEYKFGGYVLNDSLFNAPATLFISYVEKDFIAYGEDNGVSMCFMEIGQYDICPDGTYKIALVMSPNDDYHWYRQDSDGFWSHKRGNTPVRRIDESGNYIIDPQYADRGKYTQFIGYFAITPWNNYYTH